ncbi:hypothetical protein MMC29_005140 [Sticta canariensis]|nr:hypothetical protein [Sticta canariensis]
MQFFSIIGPLAAIAGLASAVVIPQAPEMNSQAGKSVEYSSHEGKEGKVAKRTTVMNPTDRNMIGRISNPLRYASPPVGQGAKVAKRAEPGFYFCNHADYKGLCFRDQSTFGTCVTVEDDLNDAPDQFGNSVSSVSVNDGTHCTLYRDARCEGASTTILFPGEHDLYFKDFNDVMSSFRCEEI